MRKGESFRLARPKENVMRPTLRRAGALAAAVLALMPVNSARAIPLSAANAVLLRYRFVPGQTYAYRMAMDMRMSMSGTDVPASASNETMTMGGIVRYHILRVDPSGGADAEIRMSTMTMSTTTGGHTTTTKLANQPPIAVHLGSDGRMQGAISSGPGTYGLQTIGTLPPRAVAPGARWTSTAVASLPSTVMSLAPMHMTTQNVFSRYLQVDGQRVAAIDSTGTVQYNTDSALAGTPVHMHLTAGVTGRSLFGLAAHRTVASQEHLDMRMFLSDRTSTATNAGLNMHIVMSVSLTPYRR
jgi:hypothetical protein